MGLAASQARALLLVARKSDLEYRSQCITQRKMVLAQQQESLATNYNNATSNRCLKFVYNTNGSNQVITEELQYDSLVYGNASFVGDYRVINSRGDIVVADASEIPGVTQTVPIYAEKEGDQYKVVTTEEYNETTDALGTNKGTTTSPKYNEMYMAYTDANNEVQYVKVQDSDGNPVTTAQIGVTNDATGEIVMQNVFTEVDGQTQMLSNFADEPLYTKSVKSSYSIIENPDEDDNVGIIGYDTQELPRAKSSDGYYYSDDGRRYIVCADVNNAKYFQTALRNGSLLLQQATQITNDDGDEYTSYETKPWQGIDVIEDELYSEDDALAESQYEAKALAISCQDKKLDLELKQIETQHKAVEAEEDSVKKIIENNINKTFKIFAQG